MTGSVDRDENLGADPDPEPFAPLGGFPTSADGQRALFHATPTATAVVDLRTGSVAVNRAFQDLFGVVSERLDLAHLIGLMSSQDWSVFDLDGDVPATNGAAVDLEQRCVRRDGSEFWGRFTASSLGDADDGRWGVIATVVEVSDQVAARSALLASEQRFRALVQNATDAVVVVDAAGRLVYSSPAGERLTGNRSDDVAGSDIFRYVHPDDRGVVEQSFASVMSGPVDDEPVTSLQFRLVHNDGSLRFVEAVSTNLVDDPAVNGVVVNIRDLTDSTVARSALELTENRFRRMIENISDTVVLLDRQARILSWSGNVRPMLGYNAEFWGAARAVDLVHPDDIAGAARGFAAVCAVPGSAVAGELRVRRADGAWIDAELSAVNLLDDPAVGAVVLTGRNISERKQVERDLNEARDQAVRALEMRTEFVASVSHELRSPIQGLLGLSELLASAPLDDDARQLARSIERATETMRMVLDDILDYSKIDVGRLEIEPRPLFVADIVDDVVALFGAEANAKRIDLVMEAEAGFPSCVRVDGLRVRQVLVNLVANAVRFTSSGEVRVRASRDGDLSDRRTRVRIEVSDTGVGIEPEAFDRLFEPFAQASNSTAREFGGTGLGLSIAKRLVELMGGELGFESVVGQGSTFWFVLPVEVLDPGGPIELLAGSVDPASDPTGVRVLVVEDGEINQVVVRRQLQRLGFDVSVCASGAEAIDHFVEVGAAVVLMDLQLPGIDGLETTRRLRTLEREIGAPRTPIVALTARARADDRQRCLRAGMDDFVAKPVSLTVLAEVVRRWSSTSHPEPHDERGFVGRFGRGCGPGPTGAVDVAVLERLVDDLADAQVVATVMRAYLRELQPRLATIAKSWRAGDRAALVAAAHLLGSTSEAVGASHLASYCRVLESSDGVEPPFTLEDIGAEGEAVAHDLSRELRRLLEVPPR